MIPRIPDFVFCIVHLKQKTSRSILAMLVLHMFSLFIVLDSSLTLCQPDSLRKSVDTKNVVLLRLKFLLKNNGIFGCSFLIMLVCVIPGLRRIMLLRSALIFLEYNCCTHVRCPLVSSARCTYETFMAAITLRSTHSLWVKDDLPLW